MALPRLRAQPLASQPLASHPPLSAPQRLPQVDGPENMERILAARGKSATEPGRPDEYRIKWRNKSYARCTWRGPTRLRTERAPLRRRGGGGGAG